MVHSTHQPSAYLTSPCPYRFESIRIDPSGPRTDNNASYTAHTEDPVRIGHEPAYRTRHCSCTSNTQETSSSEQPPCPCILNDGLCSIFGCFYAYVRSSAGSYTSPCYPMPASLSTLPSDREYTAAHISDAVCKGVESYCNTT